MMISPQRREGHASAVSCDKFELQRLKLHANNRNRRQTEPVESAETNQNRKRKENVKERRYEVVNLSRHFYVISTVVLETVTVVVYEWKKVISCGNNGVNTANHFT